RNTARESSDVGTRPPCASTPPTAYRICQAPQHGDLRETVCAPKTDRAAPESLLLRRSSARGWVGPQDHQQSGKEIEPRGDRRQVGEFALGVETASHRAETVQRGDSGRGGQRRF